MVIMLEITAHELLLCLSRGPADCLLFTGMKRVTMLILCLFRLVLRCFKQIATLSEK